MTQGLVLALLLPLIIGYESFGIFRAPFVFDDYTHIFYASKWSWYTVVSEFGPVQQKPGLFYRPLGFFLYWLSYLWAGNVPWRWHGISIALHIGNTYLVYALCRKLRLIRPASLGAAMLFGINGCATEAIAWIDARFDLIATGLTLATLIFVCQYLESGRRARLAAGLIAALCAVLSKESAFCLPLLLLSLVPFFQAKPQRARIRVAWQSISGLCCAVFVYRWWAVGGIGGYAVSRIAVSELILHRLNALSVREWAILFFPINWSTPVSSATRAVAAILPAILVFSAFAGRLPRRQYIACLGFIVAAALPAQKMLLIGVDLSGTRALYLPSVGLAVVWGLLFNQARSRQRTLLVCSFLVANSVLLEHNLEAWRTIPVMAASVCKSFGEAIARTPGSALVQGLPATEAGVVFLANGFPECVQMNSGVDRERVEVGNESRRSGPRRDVRVFVWNDARHGLQEITSGTLR